MGGGGALAFFFLRTGPLSTTGLACAVRVWAARSASGEKGTVPASSPLVTFKLGVTEEESGTAVGWLAMLL